MAWQRVDGPRHLPPREVWVDDGEALSRYDYLTIVVRGYSDLGLKAPVELREELAVLVAAEVARLEAIKSAWWKQTLAELNWVPDDPSRFTDLRGGEHG